MDKIQLRKKAKSVRASLDMKSISERIVANIRSFEPYKRAKNVMLFYPIANEVDLLELLKDDSKHFYLPRVDGNELLVCPFMLGDELTTSSFKTLEPISEPIENTDILDVIFVPALMVDKTLNRLGYGGGFYDRFLSKQSPNTLKIVAIPSQLVIDEIPPDDFDERVDVTICED